jgi:hypothetical protein
MYSHDVAHMSEKEIRGYHGSLIAEGSLDFTPFSIR